MSCARSEKQAAVRTTSRPSSTTQTSPADRRYRAASKGERNYVAPAKNKQEPPTKSGRRHHSSTEKTGTVYEPQRVGYPCLQDPANVIAKLSVKWPAEMQEEQRVPVHGREFKGCEWHWTTNNRHQKDVLEMGSLRGYVQPQSATE